MSPVTAGAHLLILLSLITELDGDHYYCYKTADCQCLVTIMSCNRDWSDR